MKLVTVLGTTGLIMAFSLNAQAAEPAKKAPKMTTAEVIPPPAPPPVRSGGPPKLNAPERPQAQVATNERLTLKDAMKLREQA